MINLDVHREKRSELKHTQKVQANLHTGCKHGTHTACMYIRTCVLESNTSYTVENLRHAHRRYILMTVLCVFSYVTLVTVTTPLAQSSQKYQVLGACNSCALADK
jgi:hypothetical protein